MNELLVLSAVAVGLGALGVVVLRVPSTVTLSVGIAAAVFSGHSSHMGLPVPPDRVLIYLGLLLLLLGTERSELPVRLRFRSQHAFMIAMALYALVSSLVAGTFLGEAAGHYAVLDRLSVTAFVLFSVAPIVFFDRRRRNVFLGVMVATGAYLGVVALLEGIGAKELAWPSYIGDPEVGIHFDRTRGPIGESAGFGLALFECAIASVVAFRVWTSRAGRWIAVAVALLCLLGTVFTLTRAVWVGVVLGIVAACVVSREWRRRLIPVGAVMGVILVAALSIFPSLSAQVSERGGDERPIWDRLNLIDAGVRAVQENPLFGTGWRTFADDGAEYFRLLPDIPQTGTNLDVHNVVLSHAAELGLIGALMWLLVVATTIGAAMVWRAPPELEDWRVGMVAMGVQWAVVAMFTPFSYTFSFLFVWTWAGILAGHHFVRPRHPEPDDPDVVSPPAPHPPISARTLETPAPLVEEPADARIPG